MKSSDNRGTADRTSPEEPAKYWFMRMRWGIDDYTKELWEAGSAGVFCGSWRIGLVLDASGEVDQAKLCASAIKAQCPTDDWLTDKALEQTRMFLLKVKVGHRIVVMSDEFVNIGMVAPGFIDGPMTRTGDESFKCRPITSPKPFLLAELPSAFRLLSSTGRRAIQEVGACGKLVALLDRCDSPKAVKEELAKMPVPEFLEMLSPNQWELLCAEYLRDTIGLRSLLLDVGRTLKAVDIVGVDWNHKRVVAQCKNSKDRIDASQIHAWLKDPQSAIDKNNDRAFFFSRGGVDGQVQGCSVLDGKQIAGWLESDPDYFMDLKKL